MKTYKILALNLFAIVFVSANAAETDTFTNRNEPLEDSAIIISKKANEYLKISIVEANKTGSCVEANLYKEMRKYFNNHISGQLAKEIINGTEVPKRKVVIENSVYRDWTAWDGMGMGFSTVRKSGLTISPVIRVGNTQIGTDKFEHFFGQGFGYFSSNFLKNKGVEKTVKLGIAKEKIVLGGNKFGNGVFSYGDLSANFNGMRFWNHILQLREDPIGADHNLGPYVICDSKQWVQVKEIDFRDYIDDSMDEAINCSKFPAKKTAEKFLGEVHKLGLSCPVDIKRLEELHTKYKTDAKWIINTEGTGVISYFKEFKNKK